MKVSSTGEFTMDAIPDAPEWFASFLEDYNAQKTQNLSALRALTFGDNTKYREKTVNLVHGTATTVRVPDGVGVVKSVVALQCEGVALDSTGKPTGSIYDLGLAQPIEWKQSGVDGSVIVTARFSPPEGSISLIRSTTQAIAHNANDFVSWSSGTASGNLSYSTTTVTCAKAGVVAVQYGSLFDTAAGGRRAWAVITGASVYYADQQIPVASDYVAGTGAAEIVVAAGDTFRLFAFQNQTAVATLNLLANRTRMQARYVAPVVGTTGRINLIFVGE